MTIPRIKFIFDRRKRAGLKCKGSIELRMTFGKIQKFIATGVMIFPKQWDAVNECVKNSFEAPEYNRILQAYRQRAVKAIADVAESGKTDIADIVRKVSNRQAPETMTFSEYIIQRMNDKTSMVRESTEKRYESFLKAFNKWGGIITFSDINAKNIRKYDEWLHSLTLKDGTPYRQSTIHSYHKYLKQFINDAIVDGHLSSNPYKENRISIDRGTHEHIECLTEEQLNAIRTMQVKAGTYMDRVRDLFLFQCYTGLAYSDLMKFRPEDKETMTMHRTKTGSEFTIALLKPAREILAKYNGELPRISNQKYNLFLKGLGAAIGVQNLHSHMGRSTFATLMLNHGVPVAVLQKMLGHKNALQTKRYATMLEGTVAETFRKIDEECNF